MHDREPFDRALRRIRRNRAAASFARHGFLQAHIAEELLARLDAVRREFELALLLGYPGEALPAALASKGVATLLIDPGMRLARLSHGVQCDEDRLAVRDASVDLVIATGTLDTVNDLPGALTLIRRALKPDGLFLGGFVGAGSVPRLREAMLAADLMVGGAAARIHPQIDLRAAGDLLGRAGFTLQVADGERLETRYRSFASLIADLRGSANTSLLRGPALTRRQYAAAAAAFEGSAADGRVTEIFELVYLIGWSPGPDQPRPARRGSATASLAEALKPTAR